MTAKSKRLGEVFDAHTAAEFQTRDIDATMATMGGAPHVTHVPTMTGGTASSTASLAPLAHLPGVACRRSLRACVSSFPFLVLLRPKAIL